MNSTFDTEIAPCSEYGQLEDVPAVFQYAATQHPAEPDVGIFSAYWECGGAELVSATLHSDPMNRYELVKVFGEEELLRVEGCAQERILELLESGGLRPDDDADDDADDYGDYLYERARDLELDRQPLRLDIRV